jgi:hypothetical protein
MNDKADSGPIGTATLEPDGTIVLDLRASGGGMALLRYPPDHPEYGNILRHVGRLKPGEEKLVGPWDD